MQQLATIGLMFYAPSFLFTWFNLVVSNFLTSLEKLFESMILMGLEAIAFPLMLFVVLCCLMGAYGMFLAQSVGAACTSIAAVVLRRELRAEAKRAG